MENTSSLSTINVLNYNTIANNNTKPIQEIDIKVANNQHNQLPLARGYFAYDGTVFPHESIILRGLNIIENNPDIGNIETDIRTHWSANTDGEGGQIKETTFIHNLPIFQPDYMGMAIIAEYYKNKYNIDIYFIDQNVQDLIGKRVKQLKNGEQVGIIANVTSGTEHVTPLIVAKKNDKVYIVTMDSINIKSDSFWCFLSSPAKLIEICGTQHCHLLHAGITRQQDMYSCINDAIIVLKNALRKPNLINDLLKASQTMEVTCYDKYSAKTVYRISRVEFPKFLYKTVQNRQLLYGLTLEDLQTPLTVESTAVSSEKMQKTLQTHLKKYSKILSVLRKITDSSNEYKETNTKQNWLVNTYLQTKPYRMLVKSVDEITGDNGEINQETARKLMKKYVNPSV
jgi:hypothetical protein